MGNIKIPINLALRIYNFPTFTPIYMLKNTKFTLLYLIYIDFPNSQKSEANVEK